MPLWYMVRKPCRQQEYFPNNIAFDRVIPSLPSSITGWWSSRKASILTVSMQCQEEKKKWLKEATKQNLFIFLDTFYPLTSTHLL